MCSLPSSSPPGALFPRSCSPRVFGLRRSINVTCSVSSLPSSLSSDRPSLPFENLPVLSLPTPTLPALPRNSSATPLRREIHSTLHPHLLLESAASWSLFLCCLLFLSLWFEISSPRFSPLCEPTSIFGGVACSGLVSALLAPSPSPLVLGLSLPFCNSLVRFSTFHLTRTSTQHPPFGYSAHPEHPSQLVLHRVQSAQNGPHALLLRPFPTSAVEVQPSLFSIASPTLPPGVVPTSRP